MAMLVLFAGAAGAGIVAAYLGMIAYNGHGRTLAAAFGALGSGCPARRAES